MKEKYQVLRNEKSIFISVIFILFGIGLFGMTSLSLAQESWTKKKDMPTPRTVLSACVVNGKIYTIGGTKDGQFIPLQTVEVYDPITDEWETGTNTLYARLATTTSVVNGKIYIFGDGP